MPKRTLVKEVRDFHWLEAGAVIRISPDTMVWEIEIIKTGKKQIRNLRTSDDDNNIYMYHAILNFIYFSVGEQDAPRHPGIQNLFCARR